MSPSASGHSGAGRPASPNRRGGLLKTPDCLPARSAPTDIHQHTDHDQAPSRYAATSNIAAAYFRRAVAFPTPQPLRIAGTKASYRTLKRIDVAAASNPRLGRVRHRVVRLGQEGDLMGTEYKLLTAATVLVVAAVGAYRSRYR